MDEESEDLYEDSDVSVLESNLALFQFSIRHQLSGKAFEELLLLFATHLPQNAKCPETVYRLKQFFIDYFSEIAVKSIKYCSVCQDVLKEDSPCSRPNCQATGSVKEFVILPLGPQLKKLMEGL